MSALELQSAIFTKLDADLTEPVYDNVPSGSPYPYVVVGDDTLIESGASDFNGFEATCTIHSWSDYKGRKEIKEIQDSIYNSLNRFKLSISGYNTIDCYQEYSETFLDPDGITRHGVQRFRVLFDKS